MTVLMGCLAPHPPIIIPEVGMDNLRQVEDTVEAMQELGERVAESQPDLLITISPHGPVFSDAISITGIERIKGNLGEFGVPEVQLEVKNNLQFVTGLVERARETGIATTLLDERQAERIGVYNRLDHGVLVPLYYLQKAGLASEVVPITMGLLSYEELYHFGKCIQEVAEEQEKKVVVLASGDLSHRLTPDAPAGFNPLGRKFDEKLVNILKHWNIEDIFNLKHSLIEKAGECGLRPIIMMLGALDGWDVKNEILSYEGPFGVGYAVGIFIPRGKGPSLLRKLIKEDNSGENTVGANEGSSGKESEPVRLARMTVETYAREKRRISPPADLPAWLQNNRGGVFVSIKKRGQLRGCIGTTAATEKNLAEEIISNAISAGFRDPRFLPISREELEDLSYSVDILSRPEKVKDREELDPKRYGVIVKAGHRTGLLLPDLEGVDTVEEQIEIARRKAGISPREDVELYRFEVTRYY